MAEFAPSDIRSDFSECIVTSHVVRAIFVEGRSTLFRIQVQIVLTIQLHPLQGHVQVFLR